MTTQISTAYPVPANSGASGTVGPQPATGYAILAGVSIAETGGANGARIEVRDQGSATGNVVATFQLAASGSTPLGDLPNVKVPGGAYVKVVGSGTLVGSVYIR